MRYRAFLKILLFIYGGGLCYLWFFLPARLDNMEHAREAKVIPFETTKYSLSLALYAPRHRDYFRQQFLQNVMGNLFLLTPFGFLLPVLFPVFGRFGYLVLAALGASLTAESIQLIFNLGQFDIDDLLLNTTGAIMGWWCYNRFFSPK